MAVLIVVNDPKDWPLVVPGTELVDARSYLTEPEYASLKGARVFNLCRTYRDILVKGVLLPKETYGPSAISRGSDSTRIVVLRNPTWEPATYTVKLDESIGLKCDGPIEARRLHPAEKVLGTYKRG
ncbi:MAG: hypothetical protein ACWGSD_08595, partial [Thermodesulfobacteriota bacterium]